MKVKGYLGIAFAVSAAGWLLQRYDHKNGYYNDPTRSEICAAAISLSEQKELPQKNKDKAHAHYALMATFQGVMKGSWLDETWDKNFWNLQRYLKENEPDNYLNIRMQDVATRCINDFDSQKMKSHELLGIKQPPSRWTF